MYLSNFFILWIPFSPLLSFSFQIFSVLPLPPILFVTQGDESILLFTINTKHTIHDLSHRMSDFEFQKPRWGSILFLFLSQLFPETMGIQNHAQIGGREWPKGGAVTIWNMEVAKYQKNIPLHGFFKTVFFFLMWAIYKVFFELVTIFPFCILVWGGWEVYGISAP